MAARIGDVQPRLTVSRRPDRHLPVAFVGDELVGTLRLLLQEPIVWPEVFEDDALYVHTLAVRRTWAEHRLGHRMLEWAGDRAASLGRTYVRLDCMADNRFLREYYGQAGFEERGEIEARFPAPVGTLRLRRYEKPVRVQPTAAQPVAADGADAPPLNPSASQTKRLRSS